MRDKKVPAIAVVSEGLAEWLKTLPPHGSFKITIPPKKLNKRERAVLKARMDAYGIDYSQDALKFLRAVEKSTKCSH